MSVRFLPNRWVGRGGNDALWGGSGWDILSGGTGNDWLFGGSGNDKLTGGSEADVFVFSGTFGNHTINDFEDGVDILDFSSTGLSFGDLTISASGSDTLIEDGLGNSITLVGINPADIAAADFSF